MDETAITDRAQVYESPTDLAPRRRRSDDPFVVAEDPETGCRGVGQFEQEACTNLVHAVEAYLDDVEHDVPYVSVGRGQTVEMTWVRDEGWLARLRAALPF